jgi:hypothetical protein
MVRAQVASSCMRASPSFSFATSLAACRLSKDNPWLLSKLGFVPEDESRRHSCMVRATKRGRCALEDSSPMVANPSVPHQNFELTLIVTEALEHRALMHTAGTLLLNRVEQELLRELPRRNAHSAPATSCRPTPQQLLVRNTCRSTKVYLVTAYSRGTHAAETRHSFMERPEGQ